MTRTRAPRALYLLGALLILYLGFPVGAFLYRAATGHNEGWSAPGLFAALRVSTEAASISLAIGLMTAVPLAYLLARRRGMLAGTVAVLVQLPLAVPPLISGILLIYVIGPYTFLGQHSGEQLTQTFIGVVIAMSFVSTPFLFVAARSAFRAVDPALAEVAATLGHGRLSRFLRVEVPAASEGLRAGAILMWLRSFGEYGTVVVLAYHPYTLPVYAENIFSSAPLSQAEAPTLLALIVAVVAILLGRLRRPRRTVRREPSLPVAEAPGTMAAVPVAFTIATRVGSFRLGLSHRASAHRLAVVGPSGSGKSMTLRTLAGLLGPQAGRVHYGGVEMTAAAPEARRLGYVPQGYGLLPGHSVWDQLTFGVHARPARAAWWLETLGLSGLAQRRPEQLSGGQRQRVSLARALAGDPHLLLLDEPFSALDAPVRSQLRRELRRLQLEHNLSTVIVTHDPEEAAMLADEIIVMGDGAILQAGPCAEVFRHPATVAIGELLGVENLGTGVWGPGAGEVTLAPDLVVEIDEATQARATPTESTAAGATPSGDTPGGRLLWRIAPTALALSALEEPGAGRPATAADLNLELGPGTILDVIDLGVSVEVIVALSAGPQLRLRRPTPPAIERGSRVSVSARRSGLTVWSAPPGPATTTAGAGVR
ncbi:ATP-binding cassette domain-containing protein [Conexibacter sp. DBS9H8]|uniref:ATP-binding cassette domain-containing protein n=1 Tax=Conexibacter sp. DBS9H8 TaxID=2937801 RepID=UPI00200DC92E|nr:ATP-binding cassette domain-containing protein [Conexibacter sp. DBS9H8]